VWIKWWHHEADITKDFAISIGDITNDCTKSSNYCRALPLSRKNSEWSSSVSPESVCSCLVSFIIGFCSLLFRSVTSGLRRPLPPWSTGYFRSECCTGGESMEAPRISLAPTYCTNAEHEAGQAACGLTVF